VLVSAVSAGAPEAEPALAVIIPPMTGAQIRAAVRRYSCFKGTPLPLQNFPGDKHNLNEIRRKSRKKYGKAQRDDA
jgi:hypothetical protein